jgi:UDP-N-acetylglucosamine--N-acetylmuramyl-(pentapeptide) pyrophosphoryl-undecaprenol N-acetylglucosamine transferase
MDKFFPADRLIISGNPVRHEIAYSTVLKEEAMEFFGMKLGKPTILVIGGSLGARSINFAIAGGIDKLIGAGIQIIWQTGKGNLGMVSENLKAKKEVCVSEFITKMNYAYTAADLVVSRAGAIALAEICAMKKPSVLVPFPHAAEDHQTVNASVLVKNHAAIMIQDSFATQNLVEELINLISDPEKCNSFGEAAGKLYVKDADMLIANKIIETMSNKND